MSTKSKHKPVTLAKSAAEFSPVDPLNDANTIAASEVATEELDAKPVAKPAKAAKAKAAQDISAPAAAGSDVVAVYRTLAERSLDQARQAYAKAREDAHVFTGKIEESSSALSDGTSAMQSYVVKAMQTQADEMFGYFRALADVKTMSDAIELQSSQSRKTLDASLRQFKDISAMVNEMAVKASTPIRSALPLMKS